jgi:hypothetical protein
MKRTYRAKLRCKFASVIRTDQGGHTSFECIFPKNEHRDEVPMEQEDLYQLWLTLRYALADAGDTRVGNVDGDDTDIVNA